VTSASQVYRTAGPMVLDNPGSPSLREMWGRRGSRMLRYGSCCMTLGMQTGRDYDDPPLTHGDIRSMSNSRRSSVPQCGCARTGPSGYRHWLKKSSNARFCRSSSPWRKHSKAQQGGAKQSRAEQSRAEAHHRPASLRLWIKVRDVCSDAEQRPAFVGP
jgi:hypothetical protein